MEYQVKALLDRLENVGFLGDFAQKAQGALKNKATVSEPVLTQMLEDHKSYDQEFLLETLWNMNSPTARETYQRFKLRDPMSSYSFETRRSPHSRFRSRNPQISE